MNVQNSTWHRETRAKKRNWKRVHLMFFTILVFLFLVWVVITGIRTPDCAYLTDSKDVLKSLGIFLKPFLALLGMFWVMWVVVHLRLIQRHNQCMERSHADTLLAAFIALIIGMTTPDQLVRVSEHFRNYLSGCSFWADKWGAKEPSLCSIRDFSSKVVMNRG
jgi:hypothetical protein